MKRIVAIALLAALLAAGRAHAADPLTITKMATLISDPFNITFPKAIPGAVVEYNVRVRNPNYALFDGLTPVPLNAIAVVDAVPAGVELYVGDLTPGTGPVAFTDGGILGLLDSNLSYSKNNLSFSSDGQNYGYTPQPDADGYDPQIKRMKVVLTNNMAPRSAFNLRFRVRVKMSP